jgi:AAA domain
MPHLTPNGNSSAAPAATRTFNIEQLLNLKLPPREFILEPILRERESAMIYAWRGAGKTQLGLGLAYAIASGGTILRWQAPRPRRVVYVDGEMALATTYSTVGDGSIAGLTT